MYFNLKVKNAIKWCGNNKNWKYLYFYSRSCYELFIRMIKIICKRITIKQQNKTKKIRSLVNSNNIFLLRNTWMKILCKRSISKIFTYILICTFKVWLFLFRTFCLFVKVLFTRVVFKHSKSILHVQLQLNRRVKFSVKGMKFSANKRVWRVSIFLF